MKTPEQGVIALIRELREMVSADDLRAVVAEMDRVNRREA